MKDPMENSGDYSRTEPLHLTVPDASYGRRLDQVLADMLPQHSRNRLQGWVRDGCVQVDDKAETEPKRKLLGGERLIVNEPHDVRSIPEQPEDIPLDIVFEDETLIVINKPAGLVVHPGSGNWSGTLMNALLHHVPAIAEVPRAGIVHRLDKDTSGLLVVAKTLEAQTDLVRQLQARTVRRVYLALAAGAITTGGGIDSPIGRHPVQRIKMAVVPESRGGKPALTWFRIMEKFPYCTFIECSLETGRTHQIRVHMASLHHPLVGDQVYGKPNAKLPVFPRQALHATRLGLVHPLSGFKMQWEVPMPEDMRNLLDSLRNG
ncbi:23S rRNA pseudouridine(1911/1915/1917) synthase RluD [Dechloromonas denitrificans]|uniref:23S rRNA pseudouridine(1911/1915/1917) synthase RluD n=1 Tax=Dechloromonas denitrificans TaxID=281362 RepID=UPI001CF8593A|nr:23S rRNA pseudouridine(1911/1915/1917) synthase RluD [Dechloromonas denitrificans]UCV05392.1 23S rRNA pseudouridine(1911/1915/1917) synthase RluD [Dechloromonas denitrificans]